MFVALKTFQRFGEGECDVSVVSETGVRFGVSSTIREPTRPSSGHFPAPFVLLVTTKVKTRGGLTRNAFVSVSVALTCRVEFSFGLFLCFRWAI